MRDQVGRRNPNWKGGRTTRGGYIVVRVPSHPRAHAGGYVYEHVLIAERALGRFLPVGCDVHHVDGNKQNNDPSNLVICQDHAYHFLLHRRAAALEACGDPSAHRCQLCGRYERQDDMLKYDHKKNGLVARHRSCMAAYRLRQKKRLQFNTADVGVAV